jgi:lactoylglutathione lyase
MTNLFVLSIVASCSLLAADKLPIGGFSHVGFRVADLDRTTTFYYGSLHLRQAFDQKDASGKTNLAVLQVNDNQFLEFAPGAPAGFTHVAFLTDKLEALRESVARLGLNPPDLRTGRDRTRNFSIKDPDGHRIEFVQYEPDSLQAQSRGKAIEVRRIVEAVHHVGLPVADRQAALAFFRDKLGFIEGKPGFLHPPNAPNEFIELLPASSSVHLGLALHQTEQLRVSRDPDGLDFEFLPPVN